MRRWSWVLLAAGVLAESGCGHAGQVSPTGSPVRVEVTNQFALPMEIHILAGGADHRLGTVHPGMTIRFTVPQAMIGNGSVELQADPGPGNPTARSGVLLLAPGDIVEWHIGAQPFNSPITVHSPRPKD